MGCDIHGFIEVYDGSWTNCVNVGSMYGRNYSFFGKFFDVRPQTDDNEPLFADRGMPPDPSYETQDSYQTWGADGHSLTYFHIDEFDKLVNDQMIEEFYKEGILDEAAINLIRIMRFLKTIYKDVRMIVWFDN